jgi:hypothetical protein
MVARVAAPELCEVPPDGRELSFGDASHQFVHLDGRGNHERAAALTFAFRFIGPSN